MVEEIDIWGQQRLYGAKHAQIATPCSKGGSNLYEKMSKMVFTLMRIIVIEGWWGWSLLLITLKNIYLNMFIISAIWLFDVTFWARNKKQTNCGNSAFLMIREINNFNDLQPQIEKKSEMNYTIWTQLSVTTYYIFNSNNRPFYSCYDGIFYKFDNLLHTVSITFKFHYVFDLSYQGQSKLLWEFIQKYFFEINSDTSSTALSTLKES